jgi:TRAP-type mannitol/chloroaromatic compound transport system substrate-binding protein
MKKITSMILALVFAVSLIGSASAKTLKIQLTFPKTSYDGQIVKMWTDRVTKLTRGELKFELLSKGEVVGMKETLEAVDKGLAGGGIGLSTKSWLAWYFDNGGKALYDRMWDEMGMNVKGFIMASSGPEALGWFKEPIHSMDDFRKYRFRTPPGIPGQTYKDIGVASVPMSGGDILPALEKGTIDAAEWCCPKPDSVFGFQKVLKNYYLQGLHQNVVNGDIYINGDVYKSLTDHQKYAMEIASEAMITRNITNRAVENGKALIDLTTNHGVILHDTPADYFTEYMNAAQATLKKNAAENPFFKEVYEHMTAHAKIVVPFIAQMETSDAAIGTAFASQQ